MSILTRSAKAFVMVSALAGGFASQALASEATPRPFTAEDVGRLKSIPEWAVSPDGAFAVYVESGVSEDRKSLERRLWLLNVDDSQATRLTEVEGDDTPAFSPDGRVVAFLRDGQLFTINLASGEETRLTTLSSRIEAFKWSPRGNAIAVTSRTRTASARPPALPDGVHIFTRALFKTEGAYTDYGNPTQIWIVSPDPAAAAPRQLTRGGQPATIVDWTPDGSSLTYTINETDEPYYGGGKSGLYRVSASTGESLRLMSLQDPNAGRDVDFAPEFAQSPDGRMLAFIADSPDGPAYYAQPDIYLLDAESGAVRNLTASFDHDIRDLQWIDNGRIVTIVDREASRNVVEIDVLSGNATWRTEAPQAVEGFAIPAARRERLFFTASSGLAPVELFETDLVSGQQMLTSVNAELRSELDLTAPDDIWFTAGDGVRVHSLLQKPPGFDPTKSYPMIVWNHGGPFDMWDRSFDSDVKALAGAGYLVLYPNPRGSQGYGQAFASPLEKKWPGGRDYDDMMEAVDHMLLQPYVDRQKLGIGGISAGGIMTDWAITHTTRFQAAVSISSIADFNAAWYLVDQPTLGPGNELPVPGANLGESPLDSVTNARTPTLFISGERDYRTPASIGSELMFRALKFLRVPTAIVNFDTAVHGIWRSEFPEHPALKTRYTQRWFDHYLKGLPAPEFAIAAVPDAEGESRPTNGSE